MAHHCGDDPRAGAARSGPADATGDLSRFEGKGDAAGHHSLLLRLVFQSATRTLTETDLVEASRRVTEALTELGGIQRMPEG